MTPYSMPLIVLILLANNNIQNVTSSTSQCFFLIFFLLGSLWRRKLTCKGKIYNGNRLHGMTCKLASHGTIVSELMTINWAYYELIFSEHFSLHKRSVLITTILSSNKILFSAWATQLQRFFSFCSPKNCLVKASHYHAPLLIGSSFICMLAGSAL